MNSSKSKSVFVNILTLGLVGGLATLGYVTFMKGDAPVLTDLPNTPTSEMSASSLALVKSLEVAQTARDLNNLSRSVASSTAILNTPSFRSLKDFSVAIQPEVAGREYPFIKTDWKLNFEELERAAAKKAAAQSTVAAPVSSTPVAAPTATTTTQTTEGI